MALDKKENNKLNDLVSWLKVYYKSLLILMVAVVLIYLACCDSDNPKGKFYYVHHNIDGSVELNYDFYVEFPSHGYELTIYEKGKVRTAEYRMKKDYIQIRTEQGKFIYEYNREDKILIGSGDSFAKEVPKNPEVNNALDAYGEGVAEQGAKDQLNAMFDMEW